MGTAAFSVYTSTDVLGVTPQSALILYVSSPLLQFEWLEFDSRGKGKGFFLLQSVQSGFGANCASCSMGTGDAFTRR
jgi:hypothetical protein